jgi:hypothetical protein
MCMMWAACGVQYYAVAVCRGSFWLLWQDQDYSIMGRVKTIMPEHTSRLLAEPHNHGII